MPPTRIQVGLLDPITHRLVRDAKVAAQATDRLGSGSNQLNRFRPKLGRVRRSGSGHVDSSAGARRPQSSGVHESGSTPQYRIVAGLTREALAVQSGLSARGIADLERGARRLPNP